MPIERDHKENSHANVDVLIASLKGPTGLPHPVNMAIGETVGAVTAELHGVTEEDINGSKWTSLGPRLDTSKSSSNLLGLSSISPSRDGIGSNTSSRPSADATYLENGGIRALLSILKRGCRDASLTLQMSALSELFFLLDEFTTTEDPAAPYIYKR